MVNGQNLKEINATFINCLIKYFDIDFVWKVSFEKQSEYDKEMRKSQTTDKHMAPQERDTGHSQSHDIKNTIRVKQPALSTSERCLQN